MDPGGAERVMLARIRAGDREAFEAVVHETWDDLVEHLSSLLGSQEAAQDAAQETFIRLWEHRERWVDGSARGLVFRMGRNVALDEIRKERVRSHWTEREAREPGPSPGAAGPDELAELSECEARFRQALEALTPARRETVELVRLRGLSHREAAEALEISGQTVANRMTLALADLRILLADLLPQLASGEAGPARETNGG